MKRLLRTLSVLAVAAVSLTAGAQQGYPDKPIKLIVPWPPGGSADSIGRLLSSSLSGEMNANVFVENVAGASGSIGTQQLVRARPDGYTLLLASSSGNASAPNMLKKVGFDPIKDFQPIGMVAQAPSVLVVSATSSYKSATDIVEAAKRKPGQLSFGSGGNGNSGHLSGELFKSIAKINAIHVPYKGNTPAITDLIGGQIDYMFDNGAIPFIKGGKVKPLAVAGNTRIQALPTVPTLIELGFPGMQLSTWFGLAAPAGTPPAVVNKLNVALNNVLKSPEITRRLNEMGAEVQTSSPAEFSAYWVKELDRYKELIKMSGAAQE